MDCCTLNPARSCLDKQASRCSWKLKNLQTKSTQRSLYSAATRKHCPQRMSYVAFSLPDKLNEGILPLKPENCSSLGEESMDSSQELLKSSELMSLLADSERAKLIRKLSEANKQSRFLKRELHAKENALANFRSELAILGLETQALVKLADEISRTGIPDGSRKINGKYIQSHLLSRLEAVNDRMKVLTKNVEVAQYKEVAVFWYGMAESVQVMGSFDGWNQGEHMSPEYTGSHTKFSATLLLRPGRYEIKFLVDGAWRLSPEFPTVGEGGMKNNLLILD